MTLTPHFYDDADGKPPYNVPVLLELEGGAYRTKLADLRLNHATAPEQRLKDRYARAIARLERNA